MMVTDIDAMAVWNAVDDVLAEAEDYRAHMAEQYTATLDALTAVFDDMEAFTDDGDDARLIQAAQAFVPDMAYFEGLTAQLDAALDALRNALATS